MSKGLKVFFLFSGLVIVAYFISIGIIQQFKIVSVDITVVLAITYISLILFVSWLVHMGNKQLL